MHAKSFDTTVNIIETDAAGVAALRLPRDDLMLEQVEGPDRFGVAEGPFDHYERTLAVDELDDGRFRVTETIDWKVAIPVWEPLFRPLMRAMSRRSEPPDPTPAGEIVSPPWWAPPARIDARAATILSRLCVISMLAGYLGTLLSQTLSFAADEFGASSTAQGTVLAVVRIGVLLSVALAFMADRRGRRALVLVCAFGGVAMATLGAVAPNLFVLTATQTVSRGFATALALLLAVIAAEEMPAGARAYGASVLTMTAALGAGGAVALVSLADLAPWAWRIPYVAPIFVLPAIKAVHSQVPESRRFVTPHGKATMAGHRGRLALLATAAFLGLLFYAPVSQFQVDFLREEHGFSSPMITLYTMVTMTPGGIGVIVGGRLADTKGRRIVGAIGTIGGALLVTLTYQLAGAGIWLTAICGSIIGALTVPALAVYGPELFPTALRARANGWITAAGVAGSATGLRLAGQMRDHFDSYGPAIAMLAIGPLLVAVLVVAFYPETARVELEDLNPEDQVSGTESIVGAPSTGVSGLFSGRRRQAGDPVADG
ncbi:MAG: MFS transporter [Acidimicrobiales bacterium]|nr:MFS transporter [Acidimicrobiales bacterium]